MAPQARRLLNIGRRNDEINVACESLLRPSCPPRPLTLSVWRLCLSKIKSGHIGGAARREWGDKGSARPVRRHARPAHPSPRIDACGRHCNISCTTAVGDGGGSRRNTTTWSRHSRRIEPISRSAYPFCHGERGG